MSKISIKSYSAFIVKLLALLAILFGSAGTLRWGQGWIFIALLLINTAWIVVLLNKFDPQLLAERLKPSLQKGQPLWDKIWVIVFYALGFMWTVLLGLDAGRYKWSEMPTILHICGAVLSCVGYYLQYIAMRENSFLIPVVRLQKHRGHRVISTGPYAIVRHPFYTAFALLSVGSALLIGSWYGVLMSILLIALLAYRAVREERFLKINLEGYDAYLGQVPYRFFPYLW